MSLRELVESGDRLILTGEAPSVDGGPLEAFHERIAEMAHWVDAMNATDNTAAHAHASNVAVAIALLHAGVEPIMQVVCRDKNRLAIQADIVGAALHGVENICCLTGDDVTAGDEPEAKRVFDLDGPQLIHVATGLGQGRYLSGTRDRPCAQALRRRRRDGGRPASRTSCGERLRRRSRRARASCSCRSATTPSGSRPS